MLKEQKDFKEENLSDFRGCCEEMYKKRVIKIIKVKPHYRRDGLFRKKVKGYAKKVSVPKKQVNTKRKVSPTKKYGYWYK